MRIRSIKPEWLHDAKISEASLEARVLSIGLILLSDDHGRGRGHVKFLRAQVFPGGDVTEDKVRSTMTELAKVGFVVWYEVDEQEYFEIRNWTKHQKVNHPGKSRIPPKPLNYSNPQETLCKVQETLCKVQETLLPDLGSRIKDLGSRNIHVELGTRPVVELFDFWKTQTGSARSKLDPKRQRLLGQAIKTYGLETCQDVVRGYLLSPHHTGANDRNTKYLSVEVMFRDAKQIEQGLGFLGPSSLSQPSMPEPTSAAEINLSVLSWLSAEPVLQDPAGYCQSRQWSLHGQFALRIIRIFNEWLLAPDAEQHEVLTRHRNRLEASLSAADAPDKHVSSLRSVG